MTKLPKLEDNVTLQAQKERHRYGSKEIDRLLNQNDSVIYASTFFFVKKMKTGPYVALLKT